MVETPYTEHITKLFTELMRALVDDEQDLHVIVTPKAANMMLIEVRCSPDDHGILVGKGGRMARCLRTILSALSAKYGVGYQLDIRLD